jgi:hypothetical protein
LGLRHLPYKEMRFLRVAEGNALGEPVKRSHFLPQYEPSVEDDGALPLRLVGGMKAEVYVLSKASSQSVRSKGSLTTICRISFMVET